MAQEFWMMGESVETHPVFLKVYYVDDKSTEMTVTMMWGGGKSCHDVTVEIDFTKNVDWTASKATVNWAAMGDRGPALARTYGKLLVMAADVATELPWFPDDAVKIKAVEIDQYFANKAS